MQPDLFLSSVFGERGREKARKRALLLLPGNSIHCGRRMNEEADRLLQCQAWRGWIEVWGLFCVWIAVTPIRDARHLDSQSSTGLVFAGIKKTAK